MRIRDADTLNRLDVIAVNDGSKDCTSEMAHGFEVKCPGVSASSARRTGTAAAASTRRGLRTRGLYFSRS